MILQTKYVKKYIELILKTCINLHPGDKIIIKSELVHREFVNLLTKRAYGLGAKIVIVDWQDPWLTVARVKHSKAEYLSFLPEYFDFKYKSLTEGSWSVISLEGMEDPDLFQNLDTTRLNALYKAYNQTTESFKKGVANFEFPWTIVPVPTQKWVHKVLKDGFSEDAYNRFWKILRRILQLDAQDPIGAWRDQLLKLGKTAKKLDQLKLSHLHFVSRKTDLKVFLNPKSLWHGGTVNAKNGYEFLPNLPTYEVFTTPNFKKTEGLVEIVKPVQVLGKVVEEGWLKFKKGAVTAYGAKTNKQQFTRYFANDNKSRYLGEVALVDSSSPLFNLDFFFYSQLLDENASSHIALGKGLPICIKEGRNMKSEEIEKAGCNQAKQHTDFMIGKKDMTIYGYSKTGSKVVLMKHGRFVF